MRCQGSVSMVVQQVVVEMVAVKISSCGDDDDGVMTDGVVMSFGLWCKNYVQMSPKLCGGVKIMFKFSAFMSYLLKIMVN